MFVGVDPDLHNTGIAVIDNDGKCILACSCKVSRQFKGRSACIEMAEEIRKAAANIDAIVGAFCETGKDAKASVLCVEGQELYRGNDAATKNPRSIMFLASVAGAALGAIPAHTKMFPSPQEWKGSIPKEIKQARILLEAGWAVGKASGYCFPQHLPFGLNKGDWKHITDALGLAQWARRQWIVKSRSRSYLQQEDSIF